MPRIVATRASRASETLQREDWTIATQAGNGGGLWVTGIAKGVVDSCEVLIDDIVDRVYCRGCLCVEGLLCGVAMLGANEELCGLILTRSELGSRREYKEG